MFPRFIALAVAGTMLACAAHAQELTTVVPDPDHISGNSAVLIEKVDGDRAKGLRLGEYPVCFLTSVHNTSGNACGCFLQEHPDRGWGLFVDGGADCVCAAQCVVLR